MDKRNSPPTLVSILAVVALLWGCVPAFAWPNTHVRAMSTSAETSKTTRVVGWSAVRKAAASRGAMGTLTVTGPGSRPVLIQKRSAGKWKTVRTLRTSPDRRLNLAYVAKRPGTWRLVVFSWKGWTRLTTSSVLVGAQPALSSSPTLTNAERKSRRTSPNPSVTTANVAPQAAFTSTVSNLTVGVDAAGSTDPDGAITGYAWNWGDGTTSTARPPRTPSWRPAPTRSP